MAFTPAPRPGDELARLNDLYDVHVLDTAPEGDYNDVVSLASAVCEVPIALVSLIDENRQWFKACVGLDVRQTHRDEAFCSHAILSPDELFVVEDTTADQRFSQNPLVIGPPRIRFYAGAPIVTETGFSLGTVCVIDTVPRRLTEAQLIGLKALARLTAKFLDQRRMRLAGDARNVELQRQVTSALSGDDGTHSEFRRNQRVDALGQLTGAVGHDFNNILQGISMNLELIKLKSTDPTQVRRFADGATKEVRRGANLVAQLLAFSREQAPEASKVCVSNHIEAMRELLSRTLPAGVRLSMELETVGCLVVVNATQIEGAVLNMVINARDAMRGHGHVNISTRRDHVADDLELEDGDYVVLTVKDDGPGMPPTTASRVFEPFFTTKTHGKGTGLGLSQVMGVATRAGGTARIKTSPGMGTAISMYLRIVEEHDHHAVIRGEAPHSRECVRMKHVLLVDDDDGVRNALFSLLTATGYRVTSASSGLEGLNAFTAVQPDVVLTDHGMSGMTGALLVKVLAEMHPRIPVIIMTGDLDVEAAQKHLPEQTSILRKPVSTEAVVEAIEAALARRVGGL
ncbi:MULTISPECIES: ATP-binding protein [unclassified Caballeronia]|uniref:ATP-binding protein n=1 Tax=unclassified Caballeronia TaxID=2646786 RepID=UPI0020278B38|nr:MULTISPECIES: ATP-binding protein [unclassified Caballeronia]